MNDSEIKKEFELWLFRYQQAKRYKNIPALKEISLKLNELRNQLQKEPSKQK